MPADQLLHLAQSEVDDLAPEAQILLRQEIDARGLKLTAPPAAEEATAEFPNLRDYAIELGLTALFGLVFYLIMVFFGYA